MKSPIRIIKPERNHNSNDSRIGKTEKTVERSTREIVSTVKSWINEFKQKRQAQGRMVLPAARLVDIDYGPSGEEGART